MMILRIIDIFQICLEFFYFCLIDINGLLKKLSYHDQNIFKILTNIF